MATIDDLPEEIITLILQNNDCRDILNFAATCKRFHLMVKNDRCLWKYQFKNIQSYKDHEGSHIPTQSFYTNYIIKIHEQLNTHLSASEEPQSSQLPAHLYQDVKEHSQGDWFAELKYFFCVKQIMGHELLSMSSQCYWRNTDVTYQDVRNFFAVALTNNLSYYYTIYILHELIKKSKKSIDELICNKPYTLTEAYYAKVALRHLIHTYLAVKWVKAHVKEELLPEIVINFFIQWVDTDNLHLDEDVQNKIMELEQKVEIQLGNNPTKVSPASYKSVAEKCAQGLVSERKVLAAITQVLYHQRHMAVTSSANLDTLDIIKVLDNKCGNVIALAAIYQAVARRCGVKCELIAFPSHLFLEWRDHSQNQISQVYTVDLATGELHPKRRCPFSQNHHQNSNYKYDPDALLQYIYSSFHITMGAIKNWNTQNSLHLLDFLGTYDNEYNPYRNFLPYLLDHTHVPAMNMPLNLKYMTDAQLQILSSLSNLNAPFKTVNRNVTVRTRDSRVKFSVGMICYHKKYDYICIVHGWDLTCAVKCQRRMEINTLEFGRKQPFYHVIAADQSQRYVAQENLTEVVRPTRLFHLEDMIAREFTHFDGFAYVPNDEKRIEYPEDASVTNFYRNRFELRSCSRSVVGGEAGGS